MGGRGGTTFHSLAFFSFFFKHLIFSQRRGKKLPPPPCIHQDSKTRTTWILDENGMKRRGAPRPPCFMTARKTSYENRKPKELPDGLDGKRKSNRAVDPVRINRPVFRWEQKFFRRNGSRPFIIRNCVTE